MFNRLISRLKGFRDDTSGSVTVEFVLAMPILFWAFMATYVYCDAYRQSSVNLKAAFTVGDLLSRETSAIDDDYIDSMFQLHRLLTRADSDTTLRVTVVRWDEPDGKYYRDWSSARGGILPLTDADMSNLFSRLPVMPNNERVIVVETTNTFVPLFKIGMDSKSLNNFVVTRPRFAPQLAWAS
jgi:Flp pilus assembly protein TadG